LVVRSGQQGDADADGEVDRVSNELQGLQRDLEAKAFTQCLGFIKGSVWKKDRELFAARAAKYITQSRVSADHLRNVPQHGIARSVTPGVVDLLEVIQVERQHTALQCRVSPQPLELDTQRFHQTAPVRHTGQFIGGR
jgi:hypothetical protein